MSFMGSGLVLGTVTVTLAVTLFALLRLRAALDGVEINLRVMVTGLRAATRAARCVPGTADAIAGHVAGSAGRMILLESLKEERPQSQ